MKADSSNQLAGADLAAALVRAGVVLPGPEAIPQSIHYLTQAETLLEGTLRKNPQIGFVRGSLGLACEPWRDGMPRWGIRPGRWSTPGSPFRRRKAWYWTSRTMRRHGSNVMSARDVLIHSLAKAGDRAAVTEAKKTLEMTLDYAAHGPKPDRRRLFPPQVGGWLGDAYAAMAERPGGNPADWTEALAAYKASLQGWRGLLTSVPKEAPGRVAQLERRIAECARAILAAK